MAIFIATVKHFQFFHLFQHFMSCKVFIYPILHHDQDMNQSQFLRGAQLVRVFFLLDWLP